MPRSDLLAVSSEAGQVYFVDQRAARVVGDPLSAEATQLQAVAASPDDGRIAVVSRDGALRLWDRASGRAIGIAWLDRDRLVTGSLAGSVIAWDTNPARWADRACELAGRDLTHAEWTRYLPGRPYRRTCTDR